jgi:hypothetical protein
MRRRKETAKRLPKMAEIIRLPHRDFSFEPFDFGDEKLVDTYRARASDVVLLQGLLELTSAAMKAKLAAAEVDGGEIGGLIGYLEDRATNFAGLSGFFKSAAYRLSAVNAKLV